MKSSSFLRGLLIGALTMALPAHADEQTLQQQIDQLNQTVKQLEQQVKQQQNTSSKNSDYAYQGPFSKVNFNGFASFGVSKTTNDSQYFYGQNKNASVVPNTWLGLRFDTNLYSTGKVVAQFVAKADVNGDVKLNTEWLFLQQDLGAGFNMQIGRIRFPANIDSEVMYIGNLYATVRPLSEIYLDLSMNHLDGVSINNSTALGEWTLDSKILLWAQGTDPRTNHPIHLKEMQGAVFALSNTNLTARIGVFTGKRRLEIDEPVSDYLPDGIQANLETRMSYLTAALRYDDRRVYFQTEFLGTRAQGDRMEEVRNADVLIGAYAGPVLIYTGFARQRVSNKHELNAALNAHLPAVTYDPDGQGPIPDTALPAGTIFTPFFNRQQRNIQLGIKYDILPNVSFKAQLQYAYKFEGTHGDFDSLDQSWVAPNHVILFDTAIQAYF